MYLIYSVCIIYIYILYKSTQISKRCLLLYNIHAIMKTMCFFAHHSNGFLVTHALGHINLYAFLENKAALSFDRLLYFWRRKEF